MVAKLISLMLVSFVYSAVDPPAGNGRITANSLGEEISNSHSLQGLEEKDQSIKWEVQLWQDYTDFVPCSISVHPKTHYMMTSLKKGSPP